MPKLLKSSYVHIGHKSENDLDDLKHFQLDDEQYEIKYSLTAKKPEKPLTFSQFPTTDKKQNSSDSEASSLESLKLQNQLSSEQEVQVENQREFQNFQELLKQTEEFLIEQMDHCLETKWEKTAEKKGIKGYMLQSSNKLNCAKIKNPNISRAMGEVPGNIDQILSIILDKKYGKVLNPGEKFNLDLIQIDEQTKLKLVRSHAPVVDDRYILFLQKVIYLDDGGAQVIEVSCEYDEFDQNLIKNAVTCNIEQIWILRPIYDLGGEVNSVRAEYLSIVDPGGKIPDFIKKKMIQKLAFDKIVDIKKYQDKKLSDSLYTSKQLRLIKSQ